MHIPWQGFTCQGNANCLAIWATRQNHSLLMMCLWQICAVVILGTIFKLSFKSDTLFFVLLTVTNLSFQAGNFPWLNISSWWCIWLQAGFKSPIYKLKTLCWLIDDIHFTLLLILYLLYLVKNNYKLHWRYIAYHVAFKHYSLNVTHTSCISIIDQSTQKYIYFHSGPQNSINTTTKYDISKYNTKIIKVEQ